MENSTSSLPIVQENSLLARFLRCTEAEAEVIRPKVRRGQARRYRLLAEGPPDPAEGELRRLRAEFRNLQDQLAERPTRAELAAELPEAIRALTGGQK